MPNLYDDERTAHENLSLQDRRLLRELEKRLPLCTEYAEVYADLFAQSESRDVLAFLAPLALRGEQPSFEEVPLAHKTVLQYAHSLLNATDRMHFLSAFFKACAKRGISLSLTSLFPQKSEKGHRIAYVRNAYTDEAYEMFSAEYEETTLVYADGFREACEAVADGSADFCILPFENSSGLLLPFAEMAARFSLSVVALCRVFHADGTDATRFALLSPSILSEYAGDTPCLRFSFTVSSGRILTAQLAALAAADTTVLSLTSLPDTAGEGALCCTVTLRCDRDSAFILLAYLYTFTDNPKLLGLYKEIEQ